MALVFLFLFADYLPHLADFETVFAELVLEAFVLLVIIFKLTAEILLQVALLTQIDVEAAIENVVQ